MRFMRHYLYSLSLLIAVTLLFIATPRADEIAMLEYKIKAGYLYNFTKFITWLDDSSETFNVCIIGDNPFGELLNPIEKHTVLGRPIKLIHSQHYSNTPHCHILYLSKNAPAVQLQDNTLVVCEGADFNKKNAMIGFIQREDTIRLQINLPALSQSGLKISAKLLEVAEVVIQDGNHD
jgi:hypothetical protein